MRYFEGKLTTDQWSNKHNFIDENNVVVGYDADQSCCENAGFYIIPKEPLHYEGEPKDTVEPTYANLAPYRFDPAYFLDIGQGKDSPDTLDAGGAVAFKMTAKGRPDLYLVLFNSQNGYYGHGFAMSIDDKTTQKGYL